MRVVTIRSLENTKRDITCPNGGFRSIRAVLAKDAMGFSVHKTIIPPGKSQHWHYKNHLEVCYCIKGFGVLTNLKTCKDFEIRPDTVYILDRHDDHTFTAYEETVLISIFNPPLVGIEVHLNDGSYNSKNNEASADKNSHNEDHGYDKNIKKQVKGAEDSLKRIARKHKPIKQYLRLFLERYEQLFLPIRYDKLTILEIGVGGYKNPEKGGGALRLWAEFFPNATIIGVDLNNKNMQLPDNAHFHQGSQTDVNFLAKLIDDYGSFDIVIDDASHVTKNTVITFDALWQATTKYYIIEDLHMKSSKGTTKYFSKIAGADFLTKNMCVIQKSPFKSPVYAVQAIPLAEREV